MKTAEFTDYASAAAFIAAGRKKGERSTSDGWNTVLYERGADFVLELHGTEIVRYSAHRTDVQIPMRNHVVADRLQRYGFADQFRLNTGPKWSLSQKWGEMVGIVTNPTIWYPALAEVPNTVAFDSTGLVAPVAATMPAVLSALDRQKVFEPAIKQWLTAAMKLLDAGWSFTDSDWKKCPQCDGINKPGDQMLAWHANHSHVLSHVLEGIVLPSTVVGLMMAVGGTRLLGATIDAFGNGTIGGKGNIAYNHDYVRRSLKNALRHTYR